MCRRWHRLGRTWLLAATMLVCMPVYAHAACTSIERADARGAAEDLHAIRASRQPGESDAAAVLARARRTCAYLRFAHAVAQAYHDQGAPSTAARVTVLGVDLHEENGTWRADLEQLAHRLATARRPALARAARAQLRSYASVAGPGAVSWSSDPTRPRWQPREQSLIVAALARSAKPGDVWLAHAGTASFAATTRRAAVRGELLVEQLRIARRLQLATRAAGASPAARAADRVARDALARASTAPTRGWSRVDGHWASTGEHRALLSLVRAVQQRTRDPRAAAAIVKLARALHAMPQVRYEQLPRGVFYPWPRDASFDDQGVRIDVDKPSTLRLVIYGAGALPVRVIEQATDPGAVTLSWDGADSQGETLGPGIYRYSIEALDPLRNRARVAGLDRFEIARDTTPPEVREAAIRYLPGGRRLIASWRVEEVISPQTSTWLVLDRGSATRSMQLHDSVQSATVRRRIDLPPGTWRAALVFVDGSGNRARRQVDAFTVR